MMSLEPRAAGLLVALWLLGAALLTLVPSHVTGSAQHAKDPPQVYYSHGMTSSVYQDLTGAYTVRVRTLRPVTED